MQIWQQRQFKTPYTKFHAKFDNKDNFKIPYTKFHAKFDNKDNLKHDIQSFMQNMTTKTM